ncbi:MAG: hypothetical protein ISN26_03070, partial [Betaproteobacteria bacterium AqS2]|nr:hypothetical protein [Betaproteobacteria bacterium AqS2]
MKGLAVNPARLQWCLRHYCLTLEELAKRAGLKPAVLRRASTGGPGLTADQMDDLAYALDFDMGFFMGKKGAPKDELRVPQFRAAGGQPPRTTDMLLLLKRVENHRECFRGLFEDFPALQPRKAAYPQLPAGNDYAAKAKAVRRWLRLSGGEDFAALRQKVEAKDVLVFVGSGGRFGRWQTPKDRRGRDQFKGFALRHEVLPIIFV